MPMVKINTVLKPMVTSERLVKGHCDIHGDWERTAFFLGDTQVSGFECPECQRIRLEAERKEAEEKAKAEEQARKREHYEACLKRSCLPSDFKDKTFDNFSVENDYQATAKRTAEKFVKAFYTKAKPNGYGLILFGGCGTGKSHIACAIIHALLPDTVGVYVRIPDLISAIRSHWNNRDDVSDFDVINEFIEQDLLVIDEIGVQAGSENERNILFQIIDARISENRPTIFITNLKLPELSQCLGERLVDRIKAKCVPVQFAGQSHRKTLEASAFDD